jgi:hypothetical protein
MGSRHVDYLAVLQREAETTRRLQHLNSQTSIDEGSFDHRSAVNPLFKMATLSFPAIKMFLP